MNNIDEKLFSFIMGIFAGTQDYVSASKEDMDDAKVNGYFAGTIRAEAEHAFASMILKDMLDSWNIYLQENPDVAERLQTLHDIHDIEQAPTIH